MNDLNIMTYRHIIIIIVLCSKCAVVALSLMVDRIIINGLLSTIYLKNDHHICMRTNEAHLISLKE